ncbi:MAG: hypothetical protein KF764_28880 [Labilithrix sp.]|nr:hypothetical protein [Labilithrix sp.]
MDDPETAAVTRAATAAYRATLAEMPHDGSTVRGLVAMAARHTALYGFHTGEAERLGLGTPEGVAASQEATKHGQRAERILVTALDISTRLAEREAAAKAVAGTSPRRARLERLRAGAPTTA